MASHADPDSALEGQKPHRHPPEFWDNLASIYLSSDALYELDQRTRLPRLQSASRPEPSQSAPDIVSTFTSQCLANLRRFSRQGGPDLSSIRDCSYPAGYSGSVTMASQTASRPKVTTYSPNFKRHLTDNGIYAIDHRFLDGQRPPKPENFDAIRTMLSQERPSGPTISGADFDRFADANERDEFDDIKKTMMEFAREIEGTDDNGSDRSSGFLFQNLATITNGDICKVMPNYVAGARPEQLDKAIRVQLNKTIEPSQNYPLIVPNFFFEVKNPSTGRSPLRIRACYEGALGARAVHAIRSFRQAKEHAFDGNAYTVTATFLSGILGLHVHHPIQSADGSRTEYMMTLVGEYYLSDQMTSMLSVTDGDIDAASEESETGDRAQSPTAPSTATTPIIPEDENRGRKRSASESGDSRPAKKARTE